MNEGVSSVPTSTHGFLFADLRDYSRFVETEGDVAAARLLTSYRVLVREVVGRHAGAEVKTEGDSFYVVFPSASGAVRCGMEILEAASAARDGPIHVGIGVHAGETAETNEGFVGSAVNIAARVCGRAAPGELLVTETVRFLTRTLLPYAFVPRGRPRLKGIDEPIPLFRVTAAPVREGRATGLRRRAARRLRRSRAAVLTALAIVIALIVGVPLALIAVGGLSTAPAPTLRPTPDNTSSVISPSPTMSAGLTPDEQNLASRIPSDVRPTCVHSPPGTRAAGSTVSVTCPLGSTAEAESVTYNFYDQLPVLRQALAAYVTSQAIPAGDCRRAAKARGSWNLGETFSGQILCYQEAQGRSWIAWTYEEGQGAGIMAVATRHDLNWQRLYEWWTNTAYYLIH